MKQRILKSLYVTAFMTLVLSTVATLVLYFNFYDHREDQHLMTQTEALVMGIDRELYTGDRKTLPVEEIVAYLNEYQVKVANDDNLNVRITLISGKDGIVYYDSSKSFTIMDSHSDRIEVKDAMSSGHGSDVRLSKTIGKNTHYAAVKSDDGLYILRLARESNSIIGMFMQILPLIVLVLLLVFVITVVFAQGVTREIVAPLDRVADEIKSMDTPTVSLSSDEVYEELKPFVDSVQEAQQVREEFSANVSHELRTPLTSITGYAEMLKDGMVNDSTHVKEFATTIYDESKRMLALIDDIMHLSRIESGADTLREPLEISSISSEIIKRLTDKAEKYEVNVSQSGAPMTIMGNRTMIEELIYNLTDNAIKYNHPDGHVYIITDPGKSMNERPSITVQDDGIGIPDKDQNRIFERFFRVDKSHSRAIGGTGLGLSIVKHIAEKHDAEIALTSAVGRGTRIRITFPKYSPESNSSNTETESEG